MNNGWLFCVLLVLLGIYLALCVGEHWKKKAKERAAFGRRFKREVVRAYKEQRPGVVLPKGWDMMTNITADRIASNTITADRIAFTSGGSALSMRGYRSEIVTLPKKEAPDKTKCFHCGSRYSTELDRCPYCGGGEV